MKRTRYVLAALALCTAAACGRTSGITGPDTPTTARHDGGGGYLGSGYSVTAPSTGGTAAAGDTTSRGGGGYLGSGY